MGKIVYSVSTQAFRFDYELATHLTEMQANGFEIVNASFMGTEAGTAMDSYKLIFRYVEPELVG